MDDIHLCYSPIDFSVCVSQTYVNDYALELWALDAKGCSQGNTSADRDSPFLVKYAVVVKGLRCRSMF